jgi:hypothetical protein
MTNARDIMLLLREAAISGPVGVDRLERAVYTDMRRLTDHGEGGRQ